MNNSTNLTLDEQFDKDCKIIKLKYEYPGYTGEEKWAIITGLTEEELNEKYAEKQLLLDRLSFLISLSEKLVQSLLTTKISTICGESGA